VVYINLDWTSIMNGEPPISILEDVQLRDGIIQLYSRNSMDVPGESMSYKK
jgi:hypothetical protein